MTLLVWWLLVSGSFLNLIIYTLLNDNMRRGLALSWRLLAFRVGLLKVDPMLAASADATRATLTTTLSKQVRS